MDLNRLNKAVMATRMAKPLGAPTGPAPFPAAPAIDRAGIVPVDRMQALQQQRSALAAPAPAAPQPMATEYAAQRAAFAPPSMPPDIDTASVVPVDRMQAYQSAVGAAQAPPPSLTANPQSDEMMARAQALRQAAPMAAMPPEAQALLKANANNPAALKRMATVGGAVMGRAAAAQRELGDEAARQRLVAARTAQGINDQSRVQEVVSDKALPFLNQRRQGLLGY
jgi:hypothetical protein